MPKHFYSHHQPGRQIFAIAHRSKSEAKLTAIPEAIDPEFLGSKRSGTKGIYAGRWTRPSSRASSGQRSLGERQYESNGAAYHVGIWEIGAAYRRDDIRN